MLHTKNKTLIATITIVSVITAVVVLNAQNTSLYLEKTNDSAEQIKDKAEPRNEPPIVEYNDLSGYSLDRKEKSKKFNRQQSILHEGITRSYLKNSLINFALLCHDAKN